jgi:1-phosphofructokinase family hexose kinase
VKLPVVVALNPSIDAEWRVEGVCWEEKNNVLSQRRWAGGKGVNVARWLKHLGENPQLLLPLGGVSGRELAACLKREKISARVIPIREATRVNVIVSTKAQGQLRFNPLGPLLSKREWQMTLSRIRAALRHASCLILSGSLPRGVPVNAYAQIIRLARAAKIPELLDCDGPALAAAVLAKPFLVKPNDHELAQWATTTGRSAGLRPGALAMSKLTGGWVLVSRGAKPALLVNARQSIELTATPPKIKPRNTVGAGDSLLAAVAQQIIHNAPPEAWLCAGLATGSMATQLPAGELPKRRS